MLRCDYQSEIKILLIFPAHKSFSYFLRPLGRLRTLFKDKLFACFISTAQEFFLSSAQIKRRAVFLAKILKLNLPTS